MADGQMCSAQYTQQQVPFAYKVQVRHQGRGISFALLYPSFVSTTQNSPFQQIVQRGGTMCCTSLTRAKRYQLCCALHLYSISSHAPPSANGMCQYLPCSCCKNLNSSSQSWTDDGMAVANPHQPTVNTHTHTQNDQHCVACAP